MKNTTLSYNARIAFRNYFAVVLLLVLTTFLSKLQGDSAGVLVLKLAVVPLFFLSLLGLRSIYKYPIVEHKFTLRSVEYSVLDALLLTLFVFISLWKSGDSVSELVIRFFAFFVTFTVVKLFFLTIDVNKLSRQLEDQPPS